MQKNSSTLSREEKRELANQSKAKLEEEILNKFRKKPLPTTAPVVISPEKMDDEIKAPMVTRYEKKLAANEKARHPLDVLKADKTKLLRSELLNKANNVPR